MSFCKFSPFVSISSELVEFFGGQKIRMMQLLQCGHAPTHCDIFCSLERGSAYRRTVHQKAKFGRKESVVVVVWSCQNRFLEEWGRMKSRRGVG